MERCDRTWGVSALLGANACTNNYVSALGAYRRGFTLALLAARVYDQTHNFTFAYYCSAVLLVAAALVTFVVRPPKAKAVGV